MIVLQRKAEQCHHNKIQPQITDVVAKKAYLGEKTLANILNIFYTVFVNLEIFFKSIVLLQQTLQQRNKSTLTLARLAGKGLVSLTPPSHLPPLSLPLLPLSRFYPYLCCGQGIAIIIAGNDRVLLVDPGFLFVDVGTELLISQRLLQLLFSEKKVVKDVRTLVAHWCFSFINDCKPSQYFYLVAAISFSSSHFSCKPSIRDLIASALGLPSPMNFSPRSFTL